MLSTGGIVLFWWSGDQVFKVQFAQLCPFFSTTVFSSLCVTFYGGEYIGIFGTKDPEAPENGCFIRALGSKTRLLIEKMQLHRKKEMHCGEKKQGKERA
ncbi:hypothetical protein [Kiloniella sp. b19]|uniref:hypothetical protein n=1 Tax=Kiloniella sp. GXU_MW_B19 TaxID=3141326 RepID=UPI0031E199CB